MTPSSSPIRSSPTTALSEQAAAGSTTPVINSQLTTKIAAEGTRAEGTLKPLWRRFINHPAVPIVLIQTGFGFSFSTYFLLPKFLVTKLQATPTQVGQVTAVSILAAVIVVPWVAPRMDRMPRRSLILVGTLMSAFASLAFTQVTTIGPLIFLLRVFQGLAFVLVFNSVATLVVDSAPPKRLSQAIGLFGVLMMSTNAIAPAIIEPLSARHGWTPAFILAAMTSFAAAAGVALLRSNPLVKPNASKHLDERLPRVLRQPRTLIILAGSTFIGAGFGTLLTFIQPFALSMGIEEMRGFFISFTVTAIAVRLTLGSVADRWGRQRIVRMSMLFYGATVCAAALLEPGLLPWIGGALGLAHGLTYPALNALAIHGVPVPHRGTVMTFFNGAFNAGFAASALCLGFVVDAKGYRWVFIATGCAVVTMSLGLTWVRESVETDDSA